MSREELIELGKKIIASEGSEAEVDNFYKLFSSNVPHPAGANLFFYPDNYDTHQNNIADYQPTVEEVVDKCLAYKPILL